MEINKSLRYKLIPQMSVYDSIGWKFLPYLMFTQTPNFRSKVLNTDEMGFRYNSNFTKKNIFLEAKKNETILILGGSTAFGVGSTKDENSISGYLEKEFDYNFINLAGRGFTGFQEIISLLANIDDIKKLNIKKIFVMSGINDIYLNNFFDVKYPGIFYFNNLFLNKMNKNYSFKKKLYLKFLDLFLAPFDSDFDSYNFDNLKGNNFLKFLFSKKFRKAYKEIYDFKEMSLDDIIKRNFSIYKSLEKIFSCEVVFFFQPVLNWSKKLNENEKALTDYSNLFFSKENKYLNDFLSEKNKKFIDITKKISEMNKINFYDINEFFIKKNLNKEWLFVDSVHLNDDGYKLISKYLGNFLE